MKTLLTAVLCGLFSVSAFAWPDNLYFVGGPFGGEWSLDARSLAFEKDANDPTIFHYEGYIGYPTYNNEDTPGEFKIVDGPAWNGFHPSGTTNYTLSISDVSKALPMVASDERQADTKWVLPADHSMDGWYDITVSTASGARTFTINSFKAAQSQWSGGMFLMGGPFCNEASADWLVYGNFVIMERDKDNPDIFHFKGYMERNQWGEAPGDFRFMYRHGWYEQLRPGDSSVALTSYPIGQPQTIYTSASGDTNWQLPEDGSGNGYWDFTLDPAKLTLTVNEFIHDFDYFKEMYLYGEAFNGWDDPAVATALTSTERGVYTWTGTVKEGAFKVNRTKSAFGGAYVALEADKALALGESVAVTYEKNYNHPLAQGVGKANDYKFVIPVDAVGKDVTLTLDLNAMTLTLAEAGENPGTGIDGIEAQLATVYVQGGRLFIDGVAGADYTASVYGLDGREVNRTAFTGNAEIALPQGSYVLTLTPAAGQPQTVKVAL